MLKLKKLRKQKNMTQVELAEKTGLSQVTISRCEREQRGLDIKDAKRIADALGCKLDDLVDGRTA